MGRSIAPPPGGAGRGATGGPGPAGKAGSGRARAPIGELALPCFRLRAVGVRDWLLDSAPEADALAVAEAILARCHLVELNEPAVHLIFPYAAQASHAGRTLADFWPRESRFDLADAIAQVLLAPEECAVATRAVRSLVLDQPRITVWSARGDRDDICFSVTGGLQQNRTYYELWTSEARFRQLIHHLPFALLQVDATAMEPVWRELRGKGVTDLPAHLAAHPELVAFACGAVRVTDANRSALELMGLASAQALPETVEFLFADAQDTARRVMSAHFRGDRNFTDTLRFATFDGELRDVRISVTYPNAPEQLDITLISLEDVTERLQTEAQLRQLQADFTHAARISTLGELATSIAHEVNQPLAAVVTNADASLRWLQHAQPRLDKVQQLTARIAVNARRASDIIQRIREMAVKRVPEFAALDLNEVVAEALLFVRHDIENRSVRLCADLDPRPMIVAGDRVQLHQVLVNLLVNSAQALGQGTGEGGCQIEIRTRLQDDGSGRIEVRDDGPGIDPRHIGRIFEGFFTTKTGGLGIGLAICQSIIAAHGGRISADNLDPGGACFTVVLPGAGQGAAGRA